MGRRERQIPLPEPASVDSLFWTYDGQEELERRITAALSEFDKNTIISLVCDTALRWPDVCRHIFIQAELEQPLSGLVGDVRSAIRKATFIPEKLLNRNFPIDYEAYEQVRLGLLKLLRFGHFDSVMQLTLELLRAGSNQLEASDEGLMAEEFVKTIREVTKGIQESEIPEADKTAWLEKLKQADGLELLSVRFG